MAGKLGEECEHGHLKRQCELCELREQNTKLLKWQVEAARELADCVAGHCKCPRCKTRRRLLNESTETRRRHPRRDREEWIRL